jgi:hypothetical protein
MTLLHLKNEANSDDQEAISWVSFLALNMHETCGVKQILRGLRLNKS